ncbi:MAG: hypothetical protein ACRD5K_02975 [Candidatus Acidiferrales bacterium]
MRGKDFNTGLRGVLFEARHYERMGSAVWLYAWLVLRQTHQTGTTGWVLGGAPISYKEIEEETGFNIRTLERWMSALRRHGYVKTEPAMGGVIVRITKAKKHAAARNSATLGKAETLRRAANALRKLAGGVRESAERDTQNCVADRREVAENTPVPSPISSSSIEESLEEHPDINPYQRQASDLPVQETARQRLRADQHITQHQVYTMNPFYSGENQNNKPGEQSRLTRNLFSEPGRTPRVRELPPQQPWRVIEEARSRQQILRAERDETVRRELRVGAGPEIPAASKQSAKATEVKGQ